MLTDMGHSDKAYKYKRALQHWENYQSNLEMVQTDRTVAVIGTGYVVVDDPLTPYIDEYTALAVSVLPFACKKSLESRHSCLRCRKTLEALGIITNILVRNAIYRRISIRLALS